MKSKLEDLLAKAAKHRPDTGAVEYGFETRLIARLREETESDPLSFFLSQFSKALWRSAAGVSPVVTILAVWFLVSMDTSLATASSGLADVVSEIKSLIGGSSF